MNLNIVFLFPPRMFRYVSGRGGLGLLAVRRACLRPRHAHTSPQSQYRPIKKVMVANRGENFKPALCN